MHSFLHLHLKFAKSATRAHKNFFRDKKQGYKNNTELFVDYFKFDFKNGPKKLKAKNHEKMHKNENSQNSPTCLALAFFTGICLSFADHQGIRNQHKILRFLILTLIFFPKVFLGP
jgi:hypothetical protein